MGALVDSTNYVAPVLFFVGSPGPVEVLFVCVLILLLFGAKRVPEVARTIGALFSDLRRAAQDFREQIENEIPPPDDALPPTPSVQDAITAGDEDADEGTADGEADDERRG